MAKTKKAPASSEVRAKDPASSEVRAKDPASSEVRAKDPASSEVRVPRGTLAIRTLCMPADTNPHGDIFGGWLLGQMDIAGGVFAAQVAKGRTATIAINSMTFRKPVRVGDIICLYTDLIRIGNTSITVHVEAWVVRPDHTDRVLVTEGSFIYVALDNQRRPRPVGTGTVAV